LRAGYAILALEDLAVIGWDLKHIHATEEGVAVSLAEADEVYLPEAALLEGLTYRWTANRHMAAFVEREGLIDSYPSYQEAVDQIDRHLFASEATA
jgi:hypothetical protein